MAIWYMTTKTFDKVFSTNENLKSVLNTQYVLISSRIKKSHEFSNVISMHGLFPDPILLSDYRMEMDSSFFSREYKKQLGRHKNTVSLAVVILGAMESNQPVVMLCTPDENKLKYMRIISEYVEETFGYQILDYIKYKKKTLNVKSVNSDEVYEKCYKVLKKFQKAERQKKMQTVKGRSELLSKMSKDEMAQELKKLNLYSRGMSKSEMFELLDLFFVNS